ncbi:hypothetical protein H1D31_11935 [Alishewanella sp. BS5-314]|uniref:hypothetical protein n=1 Tax=Alishewanella sp. BS5-314 TaxID=2755587 RepID=UPI0021BA4C81|nr:hypothetical protein [Alishewanella sp. BS5-314]MCT8126722.1 hypothetical protein [Alishewanella sp. BS5-314]
MIRVLLALIAILLSFSAAADFLVEGKLKLEQADGQKIQKTFPLTLFREEGSYLFSIGEQQTRLPAPPQKYSLYIILQNDEDLFITDFSQLPLRAFILEIAERRLEVSRDPLARTARGRYVLKLDGEIFYFSRGPGQINFIFDQNGVKDVTVQGMFKPRR